MAPRRISVLIPCFNAAPYVGAALESVLGQDYPDVEIIVVDDGSTDASREVLRRYESAGVKVVAQDNQGQCAAANRAYRDATGDLIKFFDADDVMGPGMLTLQAARLSDRTDAVAMGEWARFHDDPRSADFSMLPAYRDANAIDWLTSEWLTAQPMMGDALWLIPRDVLNRSGLWNERLSLINDFEFFTRVLLAAGEILYAPGARLYYRSGIPGSLSGQKSRRAVESQFSSISLATSHLIAAHDSPSTRKACANILQSFEHEHYPHHPDLRARVRNRVAELGGADISPSGPPRFHVFRRLIGWRLARRLQRAMGR